MIRRRSTQPLTRFRERQISTSTGIQKTHQPSSYENRSENVRRKLFAVMFYLPLKTCAYAVFPSIVTLRTRGDNSSTFIHLESKGLNATAVEITIREHAKDLQGQILGGRAVNQDFIIYPSQVVMVPGDAVSVQLRWIGDSTFKTERVYTLTTREVPLPPAIGEEIEFDNPMHADATVLMHYEVRVYVAPPDAKSHVVIESLVDRSSGSMEDNDSSTEGFPQLEILVANRGTAHESLANMTVVLAPTDAPLNRHPVTLTSRDIPGMKAHLLAGERRRLSFPRPPELPSGPLRAMIRPD
jgi:fimbrial chaperone protein